MSFSTIRSLAFLTPGNFADDDPYTGLEETLQLFEYGEQLGIGRKPARPLQRFWWWA